MRFKSFAHPLLAAQLCAVLCGPVGIALAVPVNYIETVSGDLPSSGFPLPTLAFDIGVNTVNGRFGQDATDVDFDSFAFTVPAGSQLVTGQVDLVDFVGNVASSEWLFRFGSANYDSGTALELFDPNSPGSDALTSVPLGPNVYNISHRSFFHGDPPCLADYTFTFELQSTVPEPASVELLMIASALLFGCRQRQI